MEAYAEKYGKINTMKHKIFQHVEFTVIKIISITIKKISPSTI